MEEIISAFPTEIPLDRNQYRSFVFQPERLSLSSSDALSSKSLAYISYGVDAHRPAEAFSSFKIAFKKALRNVKGIQLLSATIPNAVTNIPDNELIFFYYRIPNINTSYLAFDPDEFYEFGDLVLNGANIWIFTSLQSEQGNTFPDPEYWSQLGPLATVGSYPNYYLLQAPGRHKYINCVTLIPTTSFPPELATPQRELLWNRSFQDYDDLATTVNACCADPGTASIPGDISFVYNQTLNRFQFIPGAGKASNFYIPCGYNDVAIEAFMRYEYDNTNPGQSQIIGNYSPNYNLNLRLGFTWNGEFEQPLNPYADTTLQNNLFFYMRPKDPQLGTWTQDIVTAQNYGNLVFSGTCRIFADIILGSSEDSTSEGGCLSVIPMASGDLGITFYQNYFDNPLTKIPDNITAISFRFLTDTGDPFYFPNSAVITLELAVDYK